MQSERQKIEKKINYYYELNKFYNEFLPLNKLTPNQIALYHAILYIANKANKISNIPIPILTLKQNTGMEKDAVLTARKALQTKGLISFKQFTGCVATEYSLIPFGKIAEKKEKVIKGRNKNVYIGRTYTKSSLDNVFTDLNNTII